LFIYNIWIDSQVEHDYFDDYILCLVNGLIRGDVDTELDMKLICDMRVETLNNLRPQSHMYFCRIWKWTWLLWKGLWHAHLINLLSLIGQD